MPPRIYQFGTSVDDLEAPAQQGLNFRLWANLSQKAEVIVG